MGLARMSPGRKEIDKEAQNARLSFVIPSCDLAVAQAVEAVKRVMELLMLDEEWVFRSELSLQEALLNGYVHGNRADPAKEIRVSCRLSPQKVEIAVEDQGQGYDLERDELWLLSDPARFSGRGLFLIRQLMDSVALKKKGSRICMSLAKE